VRCATVNIQAIVHHHLWQVTNHTAWQRKHTCEQQEQIHCIKAKSLKRGLQPLKQTKCSYRTLLGCIECIRCWLFLPMPTVSVCLSVYLPSSLIRQRRVQCTPLAEWSLSAAFGKTLTNTDWMDKVGRLTSTKFLVTRCNKKNTNLEAPANDFSLSIFNRFKLFHLLHVQNVINKRWQFSFTTTTNLTTDGPYRLLSRIECMRCGLLQSIILQHGRLSVCHLLRERLVLLIRKMAPLQCGCHYITVATCFVYSPLLLSA